MNACPPQPGLTLMQSSRSAVGGDLGERLDRRARVDRDARAAAGLLDRADEAVGVRRWPRRGR